MPILVTGATGLVGNNVARRLLDHGHEVRVIVRHGSDPEPLEGLELEVCYGDIRDTDAVRAATRGASAVVHAAATAFIGWTGLESMQAINVEGTRVVADAAREVGVRLVHVSTVDTLGIRSREQPADEDTPPDGHIECPYVLTKRAAEAQVQELVADGLDAVIVNPAYMLGPWDWKPSSGRMIVAIAGGQGLVAPPGGNNFCDVRDVAAGIHTALERGQTGRRYVLGGENLSYREAWTLFASVLGARAPLVTCPRWLVHAVGRLADVAGRVAGREGDVNSASSAISCLPHYFASARAKAELDYVHRPVRESVEDAVSWFRDTGRLSPRPSLVFRGRDPIPALRAPGETPEQRS